MRIRFLAAVAAVAIAGVLAAAGTAAAEPAWAPAATATVHPGVQTYTQGGQCTANFIYYDATDIYIGQAAHCASQSSSTTTNGCEAQSYPEGTSVEVNGASRPGTLAYSSWIRMQQSGEQDANTCDYNDLALVRLDPADHGKVNPSVPDFGGPTGLTATTTEREKVLSYGNSSLRGGVTLLSPKEGYSLGQDGGGWTHTVYTVTPGIPGDSGSGFFNAQGKAFGTLSTVAIAPLPASNGVGDLSRELNYASLHGKSVTLANGTEPFTGGRLP